MLFVFFEVVAIDDQVVQVSGAADEEVFFEIVDNDVLEGGCIRSGTLHSIVLLPPSESGDSIGEGCVWSTLGLRNISRGCRGGQVGGNNFRS